MYYYMYDGQKREEEKKIHLISAIVSSYLFIQCTKRAATNIELLFLLFVMKCVGPCDNKQDMIIATDMFV